MIRKTQYDNYEDYSQVFRGFSKKSYPEFFFFLFHYETRTKVIVHFLCKREWQDKDGQARDVGHMSQFD